MIAGKISEIVLPRDASLMISRQEAAVGRRSTMRNHMGLINITGIPRKIIRSSRRNIFSLKSLPVYACS
jgi:hypothetical protein